jgi:hypothetical protein
MVSARDHFKEILLLHKKHKIAACHTAKDAEYNFLDYTLFSAVPGNRKQENLRICKWNLEKGNQLQ